MSRKARMSLLAIVLLATFVCASPLQPHDMQSSPTTQNKPPAPTTTSDKPDHSMQSLPKSNSMPTASPSTTALDSDDSKFLQDAAHDGMMEVQLGRLALDKATDPEVKHFAQRLIDDHSQANSDLMALASRKGVALSTMSDMAMASSNRQRADQATSTSQVMDQQSATQTSATKERHARVDTKAMLKDQKKLNKLSRLSGDAFDREFVEMQVKAHEKDVKEFKQVSLTAKDMDIRDFAANMLPTLDAHLLLARHIQDRFLLKKK